jgi:hypothetical protein
MDRASALLVALGKQLSGERLSSHTSRGIDSGLTHAIDEAAKARSVGDLLATEEKLRTGEHDRPGTGTDINEDLTTVDYLGKVGSVDRVTREANLEGATPRSIAALQGSLLDRRSSFTNFNEGATANPTSGSHFLGVASQEAKDRIASKGSRLFTEDDPITLLTASTTEHGNDAGVLRVVHSTASHGFHELLRALKKRVTGRDPAVLTTPTSLRASERRSVANHTSGESGHSRLSRQNELSRLSGYGSHRSHRSYYRGSNRSDRSHGSNGSNRRGRDRSNRSDRLNRDRCSSRLKWSSSHRIRSTLNRLRLERKKRVETLRRRRSGNDVMGHSTHLS